MIGSNFPYAEYLPPEGQARGAQIDVAGRNQFAVYPVGERFFQEFTLRQVLLNAAKNNQGPVPLALPAEWRARVCRACRDDELPCARGEPGADGGSVPTVRTP